MAYLIEEKVQIIKWFYSGKSPDEIRKCFADAFLERPIPTRESTLDIIQKFEECGCVSDCFNECDVKADDKINKTNTRKRKPIKTLTSKEDDVLENEQDKNSKNSKMLEISPEDKKKRLQFCDDILLKINNDEGFVRNILFSGELVLMGQQQPAEIRYWSKQDTLPDIQPSPKKAQKLTVWVGILHDSVIGPIFVNGHLNAEIYLRILEKDILPSIKSQGINLKKIWLQHDGLPAHNAKSLNSFLKRTFSKRIIGFNGSIIWPPRSSDLSPNGFFLWGYIKHKLYENSISQPNRDELRSRITDILKNVTPEMLVEVRQEFHNRLQKCKAQGGGET